MVHGTSDGHFNLCENSHTLTAVTCNLNEPMNDPMNTNVSQFVNVCVRV